MAFSLTSQSFNHNGLIPKKYSCDDQNISPPLTWQDPPEKTQAFVLIMDDPDAPRGTWDHWLVYNIPAGVTSLAENIQQLPQGSETALNSWQKNFYGGPCPPQGEHRYVFKLFALDSKLNFSKPADKVNKQDILQAMQGHIVGTAELIGKYSRN